MKEKTVKLTTCTTLYIHDSKFQYNEGIKVPLRKKIHNMHNCEPIAMSKIKMHLFHTINA